MLNRTEFLSCLDFLCKYRIYFKVSCAVYRMARYVALGCSLELRLKAQFTKEGGAPLTARPVTADLECQHRQMCVGFTYYRPSVM